MRCIFFILFLGLNLTSTAQLNTDSLWTIWNDAAQQDSVRLNALHEMTIGLAPLNPDSAMKLVELQGQSARSFNHEYFKAQTVADSGYVFYVVGNLPAALQIFELAGSKFGSIGADVQTAWCYRYEGICLTRMGKVEDGLIKYDSAIELYKKVDNKEGLASTYNAVGNSRKSMGQFEQAVDYFEKSIQLYKEVNFQIPAFVYSNLGGSQASQGLYDAAEANYKIALAIADRTKNDNNLMFVLSGITYFNFVSGNYSDCQYYVDRQFELFERITNPAAESYCYTVLGSIEMFAGNNRKALDFYTKAYDGRLKMKDRQGMNYAMLDIAGIYVLNGDLKRAKNTVEGVLNDAVDQQDQMVMALAMQSLAEILIKMEQYEEALGYQKDVLSFRKRTGDQKSAAYAMLVVGTTYSKMGDLDLAIGTFNQALVVAEKLGVNLLQGEIHYNLALSYYHIGDLTTAEKHAQKAFEISDRDAYHGLMNKVLNVFTRLKMSTGKFYDAETYVELLNKYTVENLDVNLPVLSEKEKEMLFYKEKENFDLIFEFALNYSDDVPQSVERCFNNVLLLKGMMQKSYQATSNAILKSNDSTLIGEFNRWMTLKRRMAKRHDEGGELAELEKTAEQLEKKLAIKSQDFLGVDAIANIEWHEVQKALEKNETIIEFVRFQHQTDYRSDSVEQNLYAALILSKDDKSPKMIELCSEDELVRIIGKFPGTNKEYVDQLYGTSLNPSSQLYELIWAPIAEHLKEASRLVISPDGLLHKISFAALSDSSGTSLGENHELKLVGSSATIVNPFDVNFEDNYLLVGGVDYGEEATGYQVWNYLDGTMMETKKIAKSIKKKNLNLITGKEATEEDFKELAVNSRVIHVATHGFFYPNSEDLLHEWSDADENEANPIFRGTDKGFGNIHFLNNPNPLMRSGLALSGANAVWSTKTQPKTEDGVLTAQEITTLDLRRTELAVLSACETGLGDIRGSEGVYGLQRAFKMAGVQQVIMSLWQVPDEETAEFMTTFYENLKKTEMIKESFKLTQKAMREKYDPYYWAAFVLIE